MNGSPISPLDGLIIKAVELDSQTRGELAISRWLDSLGRISGWFILLSGWPRRGSAFLAGVVSAFAMAPFDLVPVLFLTFPILVWLLDGAASEPGSSVFSRFLNGFAPGFFFGFGYFVSGLWWIGNALLVEAESFAWALPLAIVALPMALACFWGMASGISMIFWNGNVRRLILLAALIALAEFARSVVATGFPWNTLGYAAVPTPLLMQSASLIGIYSLSAFVVLAASLGGVFVPEYRDQLPAIRRMFLFVFVLIAAHVLFGIARMPVENTPLQETVSLRLVQPAIPQDEKFDLEKHTSHLREYFRLSTSANGEKAGLSGTTHLFWPESVFPYLLTERKDTLSAIAAMLPPGTSLVTGAARAEAAATSGKENFVFNSVYVINDQGLIVSAADKVHLVPFGEYLPFQDVLESLGLQQLTKLEGGFEPGASRRLLATGTGPLFLPLICYEIIFSSRIWDPGEERPGYMVNLTNDAWFGFTPGPFQHERQAVVRTVEEGLPLVRVANNGISGVYDPFGRSIARLGLNERGVLDAGLPIALEPTFYAQYGNQVFGGIVVFLMAIVLFPLGRKRSSVG